MISVVGIGPGDTNLLFYVACLALNSDDLVFGSTRHLLVIAVLINYVPLLLR
ncbi:cobalt-precorrin-7 (C(5))-methyltransferase, partial [Listeria monocytogenes]